MMGENPALQILKNLPTDCHPETQWRWTQRALLLERDGNTCTLCGDTMTPQDMTIEHVVPRSRGGTDHPLNLRLAHYDCNVERGNTPAPDWFHAVYGETIRVEPWRDAWRKLGAAMG